MDQPKFTIGQQVKFVNDHDRMTGKVIEIKWSASEGFVYHISSRYYDVEKNDMVDGIKICREQEIVDMTDYTGSTEPVKPDVNLNLKDQVNAQNE